MAPGFVAVNVDQYGAPEVAQARGSAPLNFVGWLAAFEKYVLAADIVKMVPFKVSNAYKNIIIELAMTSPPDIDGHVLAVHYDSLLREEIETRSGQLGDQYDVCELFSKVDDDTYRRARK